MTRFYTSRIKYTYREREIVRRDSSLFIIHSTIFLSSSISCRISDVEVPEETPTSLNHCIMVITAQDAAELSSQPGHINHRQPHNAFKCLLWPGLHKNYYHGHCQVAIIRKDNFVFSMHEYTDNRIPSLIKRNTNKRLYCKGKPYLPGKEN